MRTIVVLPGEFTANEIHEIVRLAAKTSHTRFRSGKCVLEGTEVDGCIGQISSDPVTQLVVTPAYLASDPKPWTQFFMVKPTKHPAEDEATLLYNKIAISDCLWLRAPINRPVSDPVVVAQEIQAFMRRLKVEAAKLALQRAKKKE